MGLSNIQWTDFTFNPWLGCRKVAPECLNCYIVTTPPFRFQKLTHGAVRTRTAESTWKQPLAWDRAAAKEGARHRVFCASLSDWLDDESVPIEWLADLLKLIHATSHLDWLLLTKRPRNWRTRIRAVLVHLNFKEPVDFGLWLDGWVNSLHPPSNVWIGVSAGADQAAALDIPARVHFLSCEPMLHSMDETHAARFEWIIFGGESGKQARPCNVDWIIEGVRFCRRNGVTPFVKQLGANVKYTAAGKEFSSDDGRDNVRAMMGDPKYFIPYNSLHNAAPKITDSHGGDPAEWPEYLRVREFPQ